MADISQIKLPNNTTYDLKDSKKTGIYYVKGTQTAATGSWTGNIDVPALYTGLTIMYYLPYDGSGNATLNLTLSNGTTTGAKNCYISTGRLTTHYGAGRNIIMTFYKAGDISIKGTATTDDRWICDAFYDSNDTTTLRQLYSRPIAGSNGMKQYSLFAFIDNNKISSFTTNNGTGTKTFNTTDYFDIRKIYYFNNANNVAAGTAIGNNQMSVCENLVDMRYTFNGVTTDASTSSLEANKPLYVVFEKSEINATRYRLKSPYFTQTPDDQNAIYVLVGYMNDSYRCNLLAHNFSYRYNGPDLFLPYSVANWSLSSKYVNGHTVNSDVPSDAVFTDTKVTSSTNHYTPATASGQDKTASASGATAAWSIDVVKGVTLNTDGKGHVTGLSVTSGKIPANPNSDTKVRQTLSTTNKNYPILMSYAESSNTTANIDNVSYRANAIYANPSTGNIQATQLNGVTIGSSPKFTDHEYSGTGLISVNSSGVISTTATANTGTITSVKTTAGAHTAINVTSGAANFNVPTKTSHLTNDSGFVTSDTNNRRAFYGTCSTAAATAAKVVTLSDADGWELKAGTTVGVKFSATNTASNVTLNVNNSGAKSIYYNEAVYTSTSSTVCGCKNRVIYYMYDGTNWVWMSYGVDTNSDTKVRQTLSTANKNYPLLMSYGETSNTNNNVDNVSYRNNSIYANPSTGNIQAASFNGVSSVWSSTVSGAVGDTSVTVSNSSIATTSTITPYCSNSSGTPIALNTLTVSSGSAVISFPALTEATTFKLLIQN